MNLNKNTTIQRISKFIRSKNKEKKVYLKRFIYNFYISVSPFIRVIILPFVSNKEKRNIFLDFIEHTSSIGPYIRYRYYLDFKLFYSCSKKGTGIINNIVSNHIYEKETCSYIENLLQKKPNPIFIDVGANLGLISLYMIKKIPNIKVYAFEPSPHQYKLFETTIEQNGISESIELFDLALNDKEGEVCFFTHDESSCSGDGLLDTGRAGSSSSIKVKSTTLDTWWEKNKKTSLDLIKIDTEGAELFVLKGATNILKEHCPVVFFEMQKSNYQVYNYNWMDMLIFFESVKYSTYTEFGEKLNKDNTEKLMENNYNFIAKKND